MRSTKLQKMIVLAMLVAAGIILQLIEMLFPVAMIIPGYKIGLANITGLYTLYAFGSKDMVIVTSLRIVLAALCAGTLFSVGFILSVTGGAVSMIVMILLKKTGIFSIYGVSVAGAASHAAGQVAAICIIYQQFFMQLFLPALIALSIVSGLLIAMLASALLKRLPYGKEKKAKQT
jgi:heptaprenyl diphosphate synthase